VQPNRGTRHTHPTWTWLQPRFVSFIALLGPAVDLLPCHYTPTLRRPIVLAIHAAQTAARSPVGRRSVRHLPLRHARLRRPHEATSVGRETSDVATWATSNPSSPSTTLEGSLRWRHFRPLDRGERHARPRRPTWPHVR
jgi:hypothetical protein